MTISGGPISDTSVSDSPLVVVSTLMQVRTAEKVESNPALDIPMAFVWPRNIIRAPSRRVIMPYPDEYLALEDL